jgi:hypothetical protein
VTIADLPREDVRVLWNPEGVVVAVSAVALPVDYPDGRVIRHYAQAPNGSWWRLSRPNTIGWCVPAVRIRSGEEGILLRAQEDAE